jgi:hypothetical protein
VTIHRQPLPSACFRCLARSAILLGLLLALSALSSCQSSSGGSAEGSRWFEWQASGSVQEGQVVVRDGQETTVKFKKPYASTPNLEIVEIVQAWSRDVPFSRENFTLSAETPVTFNIESNHPEDYWGSWAVIKWRARGTPSAEPVVVQPVASAPVVKPSASTTDVLAQERALASQPDHK